jgi:UDP-N-acetylglucosamine 4-epimerase
MVKPFFKKKNCWIVTGGAGFIGSNLIEYLIQNNQYVICIDNLSTGYLKNISIFKGKKFYFIKKDIRKVKLEDIKKKVDYVVHLAALGSVPRSFNDPIETNSVNVDGSLNILKLSKDLKSKKFIFASSSSVYGDSKNKTKKEDDIKNPISPYGVSKNTFENYAKILSKYLQIRTIGLRFFNVFGPNQNVKGPYSAVIPTWTNNLIKKKEVLVNGDGSTSRDFTYIDNVIQGIILAAHSKNKKKEYYSYFNLACGSEIKLIYLLRKLIDLLNLKKNSVKIKFRDFKEGDIWRSRADIKKIKKNLKFFPKINFDEGLKKYIISLKSTN